MLCMVRGLVTEISLRSELSRRLTRSLWRGGGGSATRGAGNTKLVSIAADKGEGEEVEDNVGNGADKVGQGWEGTVGSTRYSRRSP
jgi:hypothetical protein